MMANQGALEEMADRIIDAVLDDINGRRGFKWRDLEPYTRLEFETEVRASGRAALGESSSAERCDVASQKCERWDIDAFKDDCRFHMGGYNPSSPATHIRWGKFK